MAWWRFCANRVVLAFPLAELFGCSSISASAPPSLEPDGSTYPFDASRPLTDAAISEDSSGACSPANVQGYTPSWTQPKAPASACTEAELTGYGACLDSSGATSAACAGWSDASTDATVSAACRTCVADSKASDMAWGPIVEVGPSGSDRQLNVSGCLAIVLHSSGSGCAGNYQALAECEAAACADDCEGASVGALDACNQEADLGGCSNYVGPAECVGDAGAAASACLGPPGGTFGQKFVAVASVFCLQVDEDGGGAGSDASVPTGGDGSITGDAAVAEDAASPDDAAADAGGGSDAGQ
jgi:hypothetical protein